ncbi:hypothetical protein N7510_008768 [Penicillium lagena]|uniref:uncharacterized protein n=1 Tax=Penicillium lagena TaxID=94218 RepID=UPI00254148C0|nr:uncharacterized protein N7510_008768 [Penicillium lagena]KAJ5605987.1 hypothetical protein N7510_008768 [Penicillium lagena]
MRPLSLDNGVTGYGDMTADTQEPIAIVGLATRFPQDATTTENLWELLLQARTSWTPIPRERFNADAFYHPDPEHGGTFHVQGGHFLAEDPAYFDASFFNITKNELLTLDPQQRLVLENVYHALENAGIPLTNAVGSNTSVFVSGFNHDHLGILNTDPETTLKYKPTGATNAILSNRVSWFFDFKGPSMTIDTACSSSLVALHLAVQSLRARETHMAVVSGVSILENPVETIGMSHHGLLGSHGRSFSFDSRAEGYARGEGVGTIVLKPLQSAVRDGDTIRAVIRGTGVNQDGRTPGITVPSADAQERLIREVYWKAGLDIERTRFVEAHGTGTSTGDPIEAGALARAFKCRRDTPLYVGAIKSTIGHLEGGSGVASIIKSILILESGIIPPNFDMQEINPKIPSTEWDITFPTESISWPSSGLRRVSVNSFGIGGTNAHCILDDAYHYLHERQIPAIHRTNPHVPTKDNIKGQLLAISGLGNTREAITDPADESDHSGNGFVFVDTPTSDGFCASPVLRSMRTYTNLADVPRVFLVTAFDETGVKRTATEYAHYLNGRIAQSGSHGDLLDDLSFTMSKKRTQFSWRSFVMASTIKELAWNLSECNFTKPVRTAKTPEISFVFTGQGAQYQAMGRELMVYPVFQKSLEEASEYIRRLGSPWTLIDELLAEGKSSRVSLPEVAQPLCTALQIALVDLLTSWGIFPTRVIGHSSGEIAATYCAGKMSREAAWKVAYYRGYVSSKQLAANGAMMAVGLSASQLQPYLDSVHDDCIGELIISCYNSPKNNTVSGDEAMVDNLKKLLDADGVFARKLNVTNAYHSAHMEAIADEYLRLIGTLPHGKRLAVPHVVHMFSTVSGQEIHDEHLSAQYWVDNMVSPVQFTSGLAALCSKYKSTGDDNVDVLHHIVEIGPHATLQSAIKETIASRNQQFQFKYLPVLKRNDHSLNVLLSTLGFLVASGYLLDLHAINLSSRPTGSRRARLLVDLPPYSFKHTEKVIYESRLSKNIRSRKFPRHDLFGAPVADWNAHAPRWRQFVRLNENPWLKDHMVTGSYVYPGVGYLIMAIEASRQLANEKKPTGFRLRCVSMKRALIIPDTKDGIEVSLSMTPTEGSSESKIWHRFQISSYNASSDEWTEHCTGNIKVDFQLSPDPVDNGREDEEERLAWKSDLKRAEETCSRVMNFQTIYSNLQTSGLAFGPLFQNLGDVRSSGQKQGAAIGSVTVPDIAPSMPKRYMHPHLIHPTTMDSMIHMIIAAVLDFSGKPNLEMIRLPTFIRDVWVSAELTSAPSHKYTGHASVSVAACDKFEGQIRILDEASHEPCIRMDGIELTPLGPGLVENNKRQLCSSIKWSSDVHFLNSQTACSLTIPNEIDSEKARDSVKMFQLATMLYTTDALDELGDLDMMKLDLHLRKFYEWMLHMRDQLVSNAIIHLPYREFQEVASNKALKQAIWDKVEFGSAEGALTTRMGRNIVRVMQQEVEPLDLMFGQDSMMEEVYKESLRLYNLPKHLHSYLSLLRHQHSALKVLEVGSGTGSFTAEVLDVLSPDPKTNTGSIASYKFTDISSRFFEKAKQRFQPWGDIISFQSLNIERNPVDQGFQPGTYDLIFAGNVIHATASLHTTLRNLRLLLRPGGKLIMQEGTRQDFLWYPLIFGQLPGWWLANEPIRQWCPYIPGSEWDTILKESGFSGVDIEYPSSTEEDLSWQSILVASAIAPVKEKLPQNVFILTSGASRITKVATALQERLTTECSNVLVVGLSDLGELNSSNALCISLIDLEQPLLAEIEEKEFIALRKMLTECHGLLWVTPEARSEPFSSMSLGLLRTVRWERDTDGWNCVTLTVSESENISSQNLVVNMHNILEKQFVEQPENERHAEYLLQNDIIHVGRLCEWDNADDFLAAQSSNAAPKIQSLADIDRPVELNTSSATGQLHWVSDSRHGTPLNDTEVEINVHAVGLPSSCAGGSLLNEAAGVITKTGSAVDGLAPGDHVVYLTANDRAGCIHTVDRVSQDLAIKIPETIPFDIAASLPSIYTTAMYGLGEVARLCEEDTILIHSGASPVGQAAIQYAKLVKAEIYTTVSTAEERVLLVSECGIPEDHVFSNRDLSFAKGVMRCSQGTGVDVIFNTLSGEALQESLTCIAPFGRFVEASNKDLYSNASIELASLLRNVTLTAIDMTLLVQRRPKILSRLLQETVNLYAEGKISQIRGVKILNFTQIKEGLQAAQNEKVVFAPSPSDLIPVVPEPITPYRFESDASYVLAGGLGGLGRSLARWMVSRGAKNLILLSRSGRATKPVEKLVAELKNSGCNSHIFRCDVADEGRLRDVFTECSKSLPPIRGCIQCSMVLRDGAFARMSFEDWQAAIAPKVQGSWNLHEALPCDMAFFVMLSSVAGVFGNRGQSNYAAGNTFQDALAAYRTAKGMQASSINLGSVSNVGWVAENRGSMRTHTAPLFEVLREDEVHAAIEYLIDPRLKKYTTQNDLPESQLVLGLPSAEMCSQNGIPPPTFLEYSLFTHFKATFVAKHSERHEQKTVSTAALLTAAVNFEDAVVVVSDGIVERLSSLLAIPASEFDAQRFGFGGIDSLVAMEFRSWIVKELKAEVSLLDIMGAQNIRALSEKVVGSRFGERIDGGGGGSG